MQASYTALKRQLVEEEFRLWDYTRNKCSPAEVEKIKIRIMKLKTKLSELRLEELSNSALFDKRVFTHHAN
jgi:hypothetical protein